MAQGVNHLYSQRLKEIVDFAYSKLQKKINGGRIIVENEASLQLQLSAILKTIGELYEYSPEEVFSIELEKPVILQNSTFSKSGSSKAKIDIFISLENIKSGTKHSCAIELKFFKKANQREPNNRYDVFKDIHNLENYGQFCEQGFLILATDHPHYIDQESYSSATADFDFRNNARYEAGSTLHYKTENPFGSPIILKNSYNFSWDKTGKKLSFLKVSVSPEKP